MNGEKFTKPENFTGIWFLMHLNAVIATSSESKSEFRRQINHLQKNFKCLNCKEHFKKFIDTHPFKNYENIKNSQGKEIGYFKWTWELHDQVNKFLGKYRPSLDEAYKYYTESDNGVCISCSTSKVEKNNKNDYLSFTGLPPIITVEKKTHNNYNLISK